ncbi:hypothetical protein [Cyanobium sp. CH-040]|uniref:hypothetical protein n=1 Tax=Cyanobium sp. CH-040 TaxID=2823708 RepID=UPI0020CDAC97|nr:hypothetical protein [Cyanobium sp. CH-040]MCP9926984.1 hypothetical protein [Cyanobium sp. CH-040]
MGLFDRLFSFGSGSGSAQSGTPAAKPKKTTETVYLAPDEATSLGDVNFMRRSNTIRHTFPGSASSPGQKEMVAEVGSMEARIEKMSEGLPGTESGDAGVSLTGGVPKPVKKTFAKQMSQAELQQRQKGAAVAPVNAPATGTPAARKQASQAAASSTPSPAASKPGAIDAFRDMVKDLNS